MIIDFSKVIPAETTAAEKDKNSKLRIAETRYAHETKGIVVNGISINTERDSQALITGAALSALIDKEYVCRWKTPDGFVDLDSTLLLTISQEMRKYVQACFDREAFLIDCVASGTFNDEMLNEGWPNVEVQNNA